MGNVTSIVDGLSGGTAGRTFTYDALNRLATASGAFGPLVGGVPSAASCSYIYDAIGNISNKCGIDYTYDSNHPSFVLSTSDGNSYTPDANGNTASGAGRTYTWTQDNRVASVTMGSPVYMDYDYSGARIKKTSGSNLTLYPYPGYEIGPDAVIIRYFKIGNEIVAAKKSTGVKLFYHNDHLGGVNVITKLDGTVFQRTEYDPWGKVTRNEPSDNSVDPSHRFTGQELDVETGLYYYGARYYDPALARFVSPDTIVPEATNPQSLNRYSYVLNAPVNNIDPTGHSNLGFFLGSMFGSIVAVLTAGATSQFLLPAMGLQGTTTGAVLTGAAAGSLGGGQFRMELWARIPDWGFCLGVCKEAQWDSSAPRYPEGMGLVRRRQLRRRLLVVPRLTSIHLNCL